MSAPARAPLPSVPWATSLTSVAAVAVALWPAAQPALVYDRPRLLAGEVWRLWTGHWVHFGSTHLLWNLAVLLPAGLWIERLAPRRTRLLLALAPGLIGAVLLAGAPDLASYAGLSGLATALLAWLAFFHLRTRATDRWFWWSVLGLIAVKLGVELFAAHPLFARFGTAAVRPVPLAHAAGLAAAAFTALPRSRV